MSEIVKTLKTVNCESCKRSIDKSNCFHNHYKGNVTYSCLDEKTCRKKEILEWIDQL